MLYRHLPFALVIVALASWMSPLPAQASGEAVSLSGAAKKSPDNQRVVKKRRPTHQVACTMFGCQPIPRRCHPEQGYDWDGIPTGFDIIVCR